MEKIQASNVQNQPSSFTISHHPTYPQNLNNFNRQAAETKPGPRHQNKQQKRKHIFPRSDEDVTKKTTTQNKPSSLYIWKSLFSWHISHADSRRFYHLPSNPSNPKERVTPIQKATVNLSGGSFDFFCLGEVWCFESWMLPFGIVVFFFFVVVVSLGDWWVCWVVFFPCRRLICIHNPQRISMTKSSIASVSMFRAQCLSRRVGLFSQCPFFPARNSRPH